MDECSPLPVGGGGADESGSSTTVSMAGDGRYYVGVYNSRIGTPGGTLSQHESSRFVSSMTYTLTATLSDGTACYISPATSLQGFCILES